MNWRIHDFKVNINDKNLRFLKLNKPLKTQTKIPLRWLTEYGWYEFLSTIFGMTIDEIFIEKDIIAKNEESKYRNKIIEKYGSKDNQISSAQIALEFLLRQNREWRIFDFKLHGEKDVGLIKLLNKIFNTSYKSEYKEFGDNAWYELLASVFDVSLEKIDEIKKNLK